MITVWYRGRARIFDDDEEAEEWVKEIDMAKKDKRTARPQKGREPVAEPEVEAEDVDYAPPGQCSDCGVTVEENNLGGYSVTHPSRMGNPISASVQDADEADAWLERVHAEEA